MAVGLDDIANAYKRAQRAITRTLEDLNELDALNAIAALEHDRNIIDVAFFVLIFGQIERRITDLAVQRVQREAEKDYLRGRNASFERRIEMALRDHPN
jgi:hypothetical protein